MGHGLIEEISKDLGIIKFQTEDEKSYNCRVIYSCLACWIKASTLDFSQSDDAAIGVSKSHILNKNQRILEEILARLPDAKTYFYDEKMNVVSEMRDRLIKIGELDQVGFKTDIALHRRESISFFAGVQREMGYLFGERSIAVGLSQIKLVQKDRTVNEKIAIETEDACSWLEQYLQNAIWRKVNELDDKYQYFNPYIKSGNNHGCWQNVCPEDNYVLFRNESRTGYEYFMLNRRNNGIYLNKIDSFLVSLGEVKRMMFALRKQGNNAVRAYTKVQKDCVRIILGATVPDREENILYTYAWPIGKFNHKTHWIMLPSIWEYIQVILNLLGIEIMEDRHNG